MLKTFAGHSEFLYWYFPEKTKHWFSIVLRHRKKKKKLKRFGYFTELSDSICCFVRIFVLFIYIYIYTQEVTIIFTLLNNKVIILIRNNLPQSSRSSSGSKRSAFSSGVGDGGICKSKSISEKNENSIGTITIIRGN